MNVRHLRESPFKNDGPVEFDLDLRALDGDLLEVPLADRVLKAAMRRQPSRRRSRGPAAGQASRDFLVIVVEHLEFAHADVGGVALARVTNGEAVVAAGWQLEFESNMKSVYSSLVWSTALPLLHGSRHR